VKVGFEVGVAVGVPGGDIVGSGFNEDGKDGLAE